MARGGYHRAATLHAAFDEASEARELVREVSGSGHSALRLETWVLELLDWAAEVEPAVRRVRARIARADYCERAQAAELRSQSSSSTAQPVTAQAVLNMCSPKKWRNRRTADLAVATTHQERQQVESRERERWTLKIIEVVMEAGLPVVAQALLARDPQAALRRVIGRRRSRTLRARAKTWDRVRLWLSCVHSVVWPKHLGHMLDFLQDLSLGPVPKTLPGSISASLGFYERIGGVPEVERLSKAELWVSGVTNLTMASQTGNTETKRAPQPTCA